MTQTVAMVSPKYLAILLLLNVSIIHAQHLAVHKSNKLQSLSISTVRAIFSMRLQKWPDGTPIKVFVLQGSAPGHKQFCKRILGIFPYQLQQAWDRLVFSGKAPAPVFLNSEEDMRKRIAQTPGSIGYLTKEQFDESVRMLPVE